MPGCEKNIESVFCETGEAVNGTAFELEANILAQIFSLSDGDYMTSQPLMRAGIDALSLFNIWLVMFAEFQGSKLSASDFGLDFFCTATLCIF